MHLTPVDPWAFGWQPSFVGSARGWLAHAARGADGVRPGPGDPAAARGPGGDLRAQLHFQERVPHQGEEKRTDYPGPIIKVLKSMFVHCYLLWGGWVQISIWVHGVFEGGAL